MGTEDRLACLSSFFVIKPCTPVHSIHDLVPLDKKEGEAHENSQNGETYQLHFLDEWPTIIHFCFFSFFFLPMVMVSPQITVHLCQIISDQALQHS